MNWELMVSLRYLAAKRRERFISVISMISMMGVAIGVAALIVVISVMSGFDESLKDKIIGISSHVLIEADGGIRDYKAITADLHKIDHVVASSPYVHGQVMLRKGEDVLGIILKGIEPADEIAVTKVGSYITKGGLDFGRDGVVIGNELARRLNLGLGDKITVISPVYVKGQELVVKGIFTSGMYDYDLNMAYVEIGKAQELFGIKGVISGVAVKVDDALAAPLVKSSLAKTLGYPYSVRTWMESNRNLLSALKLEKTVMFLILILIVMVACFNIASSLIMTVLEKTKDIGILKAIGAANFAIMRIFAMQGGLIGAIGTFLGAAFGITLSWLLKTFKFIQLPKDIYYIDALPVNMEWREISIIVAASVVLSFLATIYPSLKASRLDPVEALRYE